MNKVILMGRLAKDPEIRYTQGTTSLCVARYTLAVSRRYQREGEPETDFINCVAFGKAGEFVQRYLTKGQRICLVGRLQVRSWEDTEEIKRWSTEVVVEEQYFAQSRAKTENNRREEDWTAPEGFQEIIEDLPF